MVTAASSSVPTVPSDRVPPYSEEAEKGVLGSVLLDSVRVMDICIEHQLDEACEIARVVSLDESFDGRLPRRRTLFLGGRVQPIAATM